ncbi:hypothetical protein Ga0123461_0633 [Mariprofundus aestuarium]|uniref:Uncharacterized protein n=1 Tax=Mariprofundus aestuarium TaxID=1921086 RepID=A0A2K8KYT2_MARES|nr:hypothetical protein Ga0123461_0633 [Mariprofundus aestuarium]
MYIVFGSCTGVVAYMLEPIRNERELTYSGCVNAFTGVPDVGVLRPPEQKGISPYRSQRQCSC